MVASEITYLNFLSLPEIQRQEMQELFILAENHFDINCMEWAWGDVKRIQEMMTEDVSYYYILDIAKMEGKKLKESSPAVTIFIIFMEIKKQIEKITENEAIRLSGELTVKERVAAEVVGGFACFKHYPQTFELTRILNCSYNDVETMPYYICFLALSYEKTKADFNKEIFKPKEE